MELGDEYDDEHEVVGDRQHHIQDVDLAVAVDVALFAGIDFDPATFLKPLEHRTLISRRAV